MAEIKFSHDWNGKISGIHNKVFTTVRKYSDIKYKYYQKLCGQEVDIVLKGRKVCKAKLINVSVINYSDITPEFLMVDTGYSDTEKIEKLFNSFGIEGYDMVMVLVLEKTKWIAEGA